EDCCAYIAFAGGSYARYGYDQPSKEGFIATVAPFALDKFEVTVARYRNFIRSNPQAPTACSGKNPNNPDDLGWDPRWNRQLSAGGVPSAAKLSCENRLAAWTVDPSGNDARPINCVSWYEAQAFCIWDHGRLPTMAEWNYAAFGGDAGNEYPWGNDPPDTTRA